MKDTEIGIIRLVLLHVYLCMYVCMHVCTYVCTYVCICIYVCLCICVCLCMCVCMCVDVCMYVLLQTSLIGPKSRQEATGKFKGFNLKIKKQQRKNNRQKTLQQRKKRRKQKGPATRCAPRRNRGLSWTESQPLTEGTWRPRENNTTETDIKIIPLNRGEQDNHCVYHLFGQNDPMPVTWWQHRKYPVMKMRGERNKFSKTERKWSLTAAPPSLGASWHPAGLVRVVSIERKEEFFIQDVPGVNPQPLLWNRILPSPPATASLDPASGYPGCSGPCRQVHRR